MPYQWSATHNRYESGAVSFELSSIINERQNSRFAAPNERTVKVSYDRSDPVLGGLTWEGQGLLSKRDALGMDREEALAILAGEIEDAMAPFYCTEKYYRYIGGCLLTDGAKAFAEAAGAFWLMDVIASVQYMDEVKKEDHQFWSVLRKGSEADIFCHDGNMAEARAKKVWANPTNLAEWRGHLHYHQHIPYTDIPFTSYELYAVRGSEGRVIMLKSEY